VLDNLLVENSASVVLINGGETILDGSNGPIYFSSWAQGFQYLPDGSGGGKKTGFITPAPVKSPSLLDPSGAYFTRSKPQYEGTTPIVATSHGVSNAGTGDQSGAINSLLAANVGAVIFFPAGVYMVKNTVKIPVGSKIIGSGWSQIMGTGSFFQNAASPQVMVQVGNQGDSGIIEISDMLFTVQGPTAGAILMEWNVHELGQGSGENLLQAPSFPIEPALDTRHAWVLTPPSSGHVGQPLSSWRRKWNQPSDGTMSSGSKLC
jgi:glucan 1,3-beta-glucosidase